MPSEDTELNRRVMETFSRGGALSEVLLDKPLAFPVADVAQAYFPVGGYRKALDGSEYILGLDGTTILLFGGDKGEGFQSVFSPLSPKDLRVELLPLEPELQETLVRVLNLPELKPEDLVVYEAKKKKLEKEELLLSNALDLPPYPFLVYREGLSDFQSLIRGINQKEWAITNSSSQKPVIGTSGIDPCICLTVYDPEKKLGAMAHIDSSTKIRYVDNIFFQFQQNIARIDPELEINLIGGVPYQSRSLAVRILEYFREKEVQLSHADILHKPHPTAVLLDTRDGRLIRDVIPVDCGEEEVLRLAVKSQQMDSDLGLEFDGR